MRMQTLTRMIRKSALLTISGVLLSLVSSAQFVEERAIEENEPLFARQEMRVEVVDGQNMNPVRTDVLVKGLNPRKTITLSSVADTTFEIRNYRLYTVSCVEQGFMYYNKKFWPDEQALHEQRVELEPLEVGLKTDIRDITFLGDKTEIYHKSKPTLNELTAWLELNPNVRIAVVGHVNGPDDDRSENFYNKASVMRAEAVINYLKEQGIDKHRMEARGMGNKEMLFPDPKTDWENQANRRIEIEVIAF